MSSTPEQPMSAAPVHNARFDERQSPSGVEPREEFLTVEHAGRPEHTPDVEGVVLRIETEHITLMLEDGERLVFDATELRSALRAA